MVTMSSNQHRGVVKAFTLIELLVVISIIALLISLILPALQKAKRHVKVLTCLAQLQQIGVGLNAYVAEDADFRYPPKGNISYSRVYGTDIPSGSVPDRRPAFRDVIAGGRPRDLFFCPFFPGGPQFNSPKAAASAYGKDFMIHGTNDLHEVSYSLWLLIDDDYWPFDWSHSGNPDIDGDGVRDGPYRPGDSDAAVIGDDQWTMTPPGESAAKWDLGGSTHGLPFQETNVLYGDGHSEIHGQLQHYLFRIPVPVWSPW